MDLAGLFTTFESTAFRLEGLPSYRVPEETAALAAFAKDGSVPASFNAEWTDLVAGATADGKTISRLRLLSEPLSPYERFELTSYASNMAAGEKIRVFHRKGQPYRADYWLFDELWLAEMAYADDGSWLGANIRTVTDGDTAMLRYWDALYKLSFKLAAT